MQTLNIVRKILMIISVSVQQIEKENHVLIVIVNLWFDIYKVEHFIEQKIACKIQPIRNYKNFPRVLIQIEQNWNMRCQMIINVHHSRKLAISGGRRKGR